MGLVAGRPRVATRLLRIRSEANSCITSFSTPYLGLFNAFPLYASLYAIATILI